MRKYRTIKTILLMSAMTGLAAGCQSSFNVAHPANAYAKPELSKCQKMIQVAQRFEEQGLYDQARHVYKLIPQDSTYYPQAKQSLASLGTQQQPAKINIAHQQPIKKIPLVEAPLPKENLSAPREKLPPPPKPQQIAVKTPIIEHSQEYTELPPPPGKTTQYQPVVDKTTTPVEEEAPKISEGAVTPPELTLVLPPPPEMPHITPELPAIPQPDAPAKVSLLFEETQPSPAACRKVTLTSSESKPPAICDVEPPQMLIVPVEQSKEPGHLNLSDESLEQIHELLASRNIHYREWEKLNDKGVDAAELLPDIETILRAGTSEQQIHAAYTFYKVTGTIEPATKRFLKGLHSTDANEVALASYYLGLIGKPADCFTNKLQQLSFNGSPIVRAHAAEALIKINGPKTEYQLALCQCAEDEDSPVRILAIVGLAQAGMELDPHVRESLYELINDQDHEVGAQAMMTLSLLRPVDPRLRELISKIKNDSQHPLKDTADVAWECINEKYVSLAN